MLACQPKFTIIKPASGANKNCPIEPPALTIPNAMPDFSGGTNLFTADIMTGRPAIPAPPADKTPIEITSIKGVVENGINRHPNIEVNIPTRRVLPEPYLSEIAPPNGVTIPVISWPTAKAKLISR